MRFRSSVKRLVESLRLAYDSHIEAVYYRGSNCADSYLYHLSRNRRGAEGRRLSRVGSHMSRCIAAASRHSTAVGGGPSSFRSGFIASRRSAFTIFFALHCATRPASGKKRFALVSPDDWEPPRLSGRAASGAQRPARRARRARFRCSGSCPSGAGDGRAHTNRRCGDAARRVPRAALMRSGGILSYTLIIRAKEMACRFSV